MLETGEIPDKTQIQQEKERAETEENVNNIKQQLSELEKTTQTWLNYIDNIKYNIQQKEKAKTTTIHKVTTPRKTPTKIIPPKYAQQIEDILDILYIIIIAALYKEIELKPTDLDRLIDDYLNILKFYSE